MKREKKTRVEGLEGLEGLLRLDKGALAEWLGEKVDAKGRLMAETVAQMRRMPEGGVLATVGIREGVVTYVWTDREGNPASECSCTEGADCEHAAALVHAIQAVVQKGGTIEPVEETDQRMLKLDGGAESRKGLVVDVDSMSRSEMARVLKRLLQDYPFFHEILAGYGCVAETPSKRLRETISKELERARKALKRTQKGGRSFTDTASYIDMANAFLELAKVGPEEEIRAAAMEIAAWVKEDLEDFYTLHIGRVINPLRKCMSMMMRVLKNSPKKGSDRLFWELQFRAACPLFMTEKILSLWDSPSTISAAEWSKVVDQVMPLLKKQKIPDHPIPRDRFYKALTYAKRTEEEIAVRKALAMTEEDYQMLEQRLSEAERWTEAEEACVAGLQKGMKRYGQPSRELTSRLDALFEKRGAQMEKAALTAERVFYFCTLPYYNQLRKECLALGVWKPVREAVLAFLHTGSRERRADWPLPDLGLQWKNPFYAFPVKDFLILVAVMEKRNQDAWAYWKKWETWLSSREDRWDLEKMLAQEIAGDMPNEAKSVWMRLFEQTRSKVGSVNNEVTCESLLELQLLAKKNGWIREWNNLVDDLRNDFPTHRVLLNEVEKVEDGVYPRKKRLQNWTEEKKYGME